MFELSVQGFLCTLKFWLASNKNEISKIRITFQNISKGLQIHDRAIQFGNFQKDFVLQPSPPPRRLGHWNWQRAVRHSRLPSQKLLFDLGSKFHGSRQSGYLVNLITLTKRKHCHFSHCATYAVKLISNFFLILNLSVLLWRHPDQHAWLDHRKRLGFALPTKNLSAIHHVPQTHATGRQTASVIRVMSNVNFSKYIF